MQMHDGNPSHENEKIGNPASLILFLFGAILIVAFVLIWSVRKPVFVGPLIPVKAQSVQPEAKPLPITVPAAVVAVPLEIVYVLKWGDTLTKLAKRTCDTPIAIAKRNGLTLSSIIYVGNSIKLQMVERCSPESVKLKTFPEKFPSRHRAGASQEKSFVSPESGAGASVSAAVKQFVLECDRVAWRIRGFEQKVLARADCIRTKYGEFIREAIATIDQRLTASQVVAIMINESQGNPRAVSTALDPCFGLMQLQGGTARQYGVRNVFDPKDNIFGGVRVLSDYVFNHAKGDHARGHASYNMGPYHRLLKNPHYDATQNSYVRNVARIQRVLEENQFSL